MSRNRHDLKWGVVIFPGANCDHDALDVISRIESQHTVEIWHKDNILDDYDAIMLPGGFTYGDYLRPGAIARYSNAMAGIEKHARQGKLLIGVCNGFQVLTEAELLPGVLLRNRDLKFICKEVFLRVERNDAVFTSGYEAGQVIKLPIAHNEGNYYVDSTSLSELEDNRQVLFRYCDEQGNITPESNPNGSLNNIAGIVNKAGNVLGMMPHPERRCDPLLGSADGKPIFDSMIEHLSGIKVE